MLKLFLDGQGGAVLDSPQAGETEAKVWYDAQISEDSDERVLLDLELDELPCAVLTALETRPRVLKGKNGLAVILRGLNTSSVDDPEDMVSVRIWLEKNRVITTHRRRLNPLNELETQLLKNQGPVSPNDFLVQLIEKLVDFIGDFVNSLEEQIADIEDKVAILDATELRDTLNSLRRQIAKIRRYLAPQRDALDRLSYLDSDQLSERDKLYIRNEADRVSRMVEDLDLARERAVLLQENSMAQIAQQQNNRMYALSIITAVFLPLGFLTGLLGINVGGIPGMNNDHAFLIVCSIILFLAVVIFYLFRRMKWM